MNMFAESKFIKFKNVVASWWKSRCTHTFIYFSDPLFVALDERKQKQSCVEVRSTCKIVLLKIKEVFEPFWDCSCKISPIAIIQNFSLSSWVREVAYDCKVKSEERKNNDGIASFSSTIKMPVFVAMV